jgi:hypothetical protein
MKNPKIILIGAIIVVVAVVGVYLISSNNQKDIDDSSLANENGIENTEENNVVDNNSMAKSGSICDIFSKEWVASITGLDIVSAEVFSVSGKVNSSCRYYIKGKTYAPVLIIGKYQADAELERVKYADEKYYKGWRVLTDDRITMNHFITYNEVQQLNDIYLISGSNEYYRITLYSLSLLSDPQMKELAVQAIQKITVGE